MTGIIFDIKRFALHDGGGIRSTVFIKGCPLRCPWCQNPEGRELPIQLHHFPNKCIGCGSCVEVCPRGALSIESIPNHPKNNIKINTAKCDLCGKCVEVCPARALDFDGRNITVEEAVKELLQDEVFYTESGGGVTLSGGEPFFQPEFSREIVRICHEKGVNTAIETCLVCNRDILDQFTDITDQFIVDLKIFDAEKHKRIVGSDNRIIFENIRYLVSKKRSKSSGVLIRTPLIPGFTTYTENLEAIGKWVAGLPVEVPVELINYNPFAENKFRLMHLAYPVNGRKKPYTTEEMENFRDILRSAGVKTVV